jgi:4'-phosphopantetheinyl transferase
MKLLRVSDEVHVWHIDLLLHDATPAALAVVLSHEERARAERFVAESDRRRFVAAHSALRRILTLYTGIDAPSIAFEIGEYGKPALAAGRLDGIRFNLSHSGDVALCAVTNACDVGIDVEEVRTGTSFEEIATQFFSVAEQRFLAAVAAERRAEMFTRVWVSKEAYVKATGRGIGVGLSSFSVTPSDGDDSAATIRDGVVEWAIRAVPVPPGFCAAVATPVPLALSLRRFGDSASAHER